MRRSHSSMVARMVTQGRRQSSKGLRLEVASELALRLASATPNRSIRAGQARQRCRAKNSTSARPWTTVCRVLPRCWQEIGPPWTQLDRMVVMPGMNCRSLWKEDLLDAHLEEPGDRERELQRRRVFPGLDRVHRLPRDGQAPPDRPAGSGFFWWTILWRSACLVPRQSRTRGRKGCADPVLSESAEMLSGFLLRGMLGTAKTRLVRLIR